MFARNYVGLSYENEEVVGNGFVTIHINNIAHNIIIHFMNGTLIFELYVVRCNSENKFPTNTCLKEIGYQVHNTITILDSTIHIIAKNLYDHPMSTQIFTLDNEQGTHMRSTNHEENDYNLNMN